MKKLIFRLIGVYRRLSLWLIRATGKTPEEYHASRVVSGRTWDEFCDALKAAGAAISMGGTPKDPQTQAEGYRYLTRLLRGGLEAFLEFGDPAYPELRRTVHETVKIGADNPDNAYYNAAISGAFRYRINGNVGTVNRLSLHTQRGSYGSSGGLTPAGKLDGGDLTLDTAGNFEVIASVERPQDSKADWLPMTEDTSLFMVRQTFGDRDTEPPATVRIVRESGSDSPRTMTPELLDSALTQASAFVAGTATIFTRWAIGFKKHPNSLPRFDDAVSTNVGGDPDIAYYHSYWSLGKEEAMVIDSKVPVCSYWSFQLNDFWMESLDYRYHRIHINSHTANINEEGSITIVVTHADISHPNALTTAGHDHGTMCFRWVEAQTDPPEPHVRVIPVHALNTIIGQGHE